MNYKIDFDAKWNQETNNAGRSEITFQTDAAYTAFLASCEGVGLRVEQTKQYQYNLRFDNVPADETTDTFLLKIKRHYTHHLQLSTLQKDEGFMKVLSTLSMNKSKDPTHQCYHLAVTHEVQQKVLMCTAILSINEKDCYPEIPQPNVGKAIFTLYILGYDDT